ncbi:heme-dependent oxidative N-demethylase subunit alpha family protein [Caenimonas terrae]|uniref:Heme-dependent oxidative N-demethylase subunit alpha family protein n=1 Tax=Caenimonas terrae TaxID=696074 RepID=A0ABW0NHQ8_9BURK
MDFDFDQIAVPFRMQPGLRRLEAGAPQLTRLDPDGALAREKRLVVEAGQSRLLVPGFDPAPALEAIADRARTDGIALRPGQPVELACEEDLAILDGASTTLPWLCVCVPSHWAPEDKLGLSFAAVHAPVADNALLLAAGGKLVQLVTAGDCWERFVWTVTPSPRHDQHPRRHPRQPWPPADDAQAFAGQCFLRAERQTFFPVGRGTRQAVFTIRVMLQPLADAVAPGGQAQRLRDALASMSDAVLAYKGLERAREPLLRWLDGRR